MRNPSPSALIYIPLDVWVTVTALSYDDAASARR